VSSSVAEHTSEALQRWADEVAALGGSEPLTRYRDLKTGTLDLHGADPEVRRRLLDGDPVRVSRLFPHDPIRTSAARSARLLAHRLWALRARHGLAAGYLATGLATWTDRLSARRPMAPVLLRRLEALPAAFAEDDVLLHVVGDPELNPALLEAMAEQLGLRLTADDLLDQGGQLRYPVVVDRLREQAPPHIVDGFAIAHRAVIGAMSDVPAAQAAELRANARTLAEAPFVALATGTALEPVLAGAGAGEAAAEPGPHRQAPPLDLDAAQEAVLAAVRDGRSVAVQAPAGTGAVQVAAGLCAQAVERGQSVLVVAEAGPRLHALARRLAEVGLGGVALDLSDGQVSAPGVARDVLGTLDSGRPRAGDGAAAEAAPAAAASSDEILLTDYHEALRRPRAPWAMSAAEAISAAAEGAGLVPGDVRVAPDDLVGLDRATLSTLRADLAEFVDLDGLRIGPAATAWFGARPASAADADGAVDLVERLSGSVLPVVRELSARAAIEVGMPAPKGPAEAAALADLLEGVAEVEQALVSDVWAAPVERMAAATGDRRSRRDLGEAPGFRERRTLRAEATALARDPDLAADSQRLTGVLRRAGELHRTWAEQCRDGRRPRLGESTPTFVAAVRSQQDGAAALASVHPEALDPQADFPATAARLARLADEAEWARRLPALNADGARLADAGLGPVVALLRRRVEGGHRVDGPTAVAVLDACVATSVAEQILATDPVLRDSDGDRLRAASESWRRADAAATVARSRQVRQAWLDRVRRAATERPVQLRCLRDAAEGRAPRTVRDLLAQAGDTVWAARPVWLAGPLTAAAALPLRSTVDLLVVLDAQSTALAHAIGVLARARQVVVLGDPQLPPPAPLPVSVDAPDPRGSAALPGAQVETPSVYAVLRDQLEAHDLRVRYGCRDERLHALQPARRPPSEIAVPPGPLPTSPVRFERVRQQPGSRDEEESVVAEVHAVVELVRAHVRGHPGHSLAVLTLGPAHADTVRAALARACLADPALAAALGPDAEEPFLLAAVDDLHGHRRDAVVLSVGFGRTVDGRLLYRFGPLNRPGGLRWLAAAVAAAREQLTVVSSVGADELEPRRLAADGLRGLRALLAEAEGVELAEVMAEAAEATGRPADVTTPAVAVMGGTEPEDPLLREVRSRLRAAGLPVVVGGGRGVLTVPLLVDHGRRPGRGVLALDDDGTASRSASIRDRERMRPEALQRAGWVTHRLCAAAWLRDPQAEVDAVRSAWLGAQRQADAVDAARHMPAPTGAQPEAEVEGEPVAAASEDAGERPPVPAGRPVRAYPPGDLLALAGWLEAGRPGAGEDDLVQDLAHEVGLAHPEEHEDAVLREAVRAAVVASRPDAGRPGAGRPDAGRPDSAAADAAGPDSAPVDAAVPGDRLPDPLGPDAGADAQERARERAEQADGHDAWLTEQRPPHHE